MSRPSWSLSAWTCAPAQTITRSADEEPSDVFRTDTARPIGELEHLGANDQLAEGADQTIDRGADIDRPAELVEKRLVLERRHDGQRRRLPVTIDKPRRNPGRLERSRALRHIRSADEHTLATEQPNPELALEPLPLAPRPNGELDKPLIVVTVPEHPSAPRRLPRPRRSGLEQPHIDSPPLQRISRRQPTDPAPDNGDINARNAHASTVRLPVHVADTILARGQ